MQLEDLGLVEVPGLAPCPPGPPRPDVPASGPVPRLPLLMEHPAFAHRIGGQLSRGAGCARLVPSA